MPAMKVTCPGCNARVPAGNLNVATDVGVCPGCDEAFAISEVVTGDPEVAGFESKDAPGGSWFRSTMNGWEVGASTRSPVAFFLVPFMCVWSGGSLGGIYGSQLAKGEFNLGISLFGIPFLLGSLLFGSIALMTVCGKVVVSVDRNRGRVFTGVWRFGWTRRFDWAAITSVSETTNNVRSPGNTGMAIALTGPASRISFASNLNEKRRYYVLQTLRKMLAQRGR
jgi:hypothetical protein